MEQEKKEQWEGSVFTLWLPVNLSEHALVPVSGLVHTLVNVERHKVNKGAELDIRSQMK